MVKPPFELRQRRDFGQLISGSFALMRQHGRPLYRAIAVSCLPLLLFGAYLIGGGFGQMLGARTQDPFTSTGDRFAYGGIMIGVAYLLFALLIVFLHALVHEFLRAHDRGEGSSATTSFLVKRALGRLFHYLGILILLGLMAGGAAVVFVLLILLEEPVLSVVAVLGMLAAVLAVTTYASLASAAQAVERAGVTTAMHRSFMLVRGDFWPTLGVSMVMGLIAGAIGYIVQILGVVVMMLLMFLGASGDPEAMNSVMPMVMSVFFGLQFGVMLFTYPLPCACMVLKFCSRVEETEGHGLRSRIEAFDAI